MINCIKVDIKIFYLPSGGLAASIWPFAALSPPPFFFLMVTVIIVTIVIIVMMMRINIVSG